MSKLREAVQGCRACDLWEGATQGVMGEGAGHAAQALLGSHVRIGRSRGTPITSELAELVTVTAHPSSILRAQDDDERAAAMAAFVSDLRNVARWLSAR